MSPEPQRIIVQLEPSDSIRVLRERVDSLRSENKELKSRYQHVETKYSYEVLLNTELIDILRAHDIQYRKYLDHKEREKVV